jgi:hypothetical protein
MELDFDVPALAIDRAAGSANSAGMGDADMGVKWEFHKAAQPLSFPSLAASLYIEFPTGDTRKELGSGLRDYVLNSIAQEALTDKTRVTGNFGYLFAGNTSTGVLGVQTTRGHVFTGGLSLLHDLNSRWTLGGEVYGAIGDTAGLGKDQFQGLIGGDYQPRDNLAFTFAVLGGAHEASPTIGGQVGFEIDFKSFLRRSPKRGASTRATQPSRNGDYDGVQSGNVEVCAALCLIGRR